MAFSIRDKIARGVQKLRDKTDLDEKAINFIRGGTGRVVRSFREDPGQYLFTRSAKNLRTNPLTAPKTGTIATAGRNILENTGRSKFVQSLDKNFATPYFNTSNRPLRYGQQFAKGYATGANLGLVDGPGPQPQGMGEIAVNTAGSFAGAFNPKTAAGRFYRTTARATNPFLSKFAGKASPFLSNRGAAAVANTVQGIGQDRILGQQSTPLSLGIDAITGFAGGKGQFDDAFKQANKSNFRLDKLTIDEIIEAEDMLRNPQKYIGRVTKNPKTKREAIKQVKGYANETIERISARYLPNNKLRLKTTNAKIRALVDLHSQNKLANIPGLGLVAGQKASGYADPSNPKFSSMLDQKPRFEIDDSGAKVKLPSVIKGMKPDDAIRKLQSEGAYLTDILDHKQLFNQYPDLKWYTVNFIDKGSSGARASFNPETKSIDFNKKAVMISDSKGDFKSTLLHEIQHAIQQIEGFARGGSPKMFKAEHAKLNKQLDTINNKMNEAYRAGDMDVYRQMMDKRSEILPRILELEGKDYIVGADQYLKLSGELEARAVQRRMDLPADQRGRIDPYSAEARATTGTNNPKDFITRFDGGTQANVDPKLPQSKEEAIQRLDDLVNYPRRLRQIGYSKKQIDQIGVKEARRILEENIPPFQHKTFPGQNIPGVKRASEFEFKNKPQEIKAIGKAVAKPEPISGKSVDILDFVRTPDRVLKKLGLGKEAELIRKKHTDYLLDLPKELDKVNSWYKRVGQSDESSRKIFKHLDGQKGVQLTPAEKQVAKEMKQYLKDWADKLELPEDQRIAHYITHIFEPDFIQKDFDPDLAKLLADKVPGSTYDPFLQKRLGEMGYIEDAFRAIDAYVKRATRKYHMDQALKPLRDKVGKEAAESPLDVDSFKYVQNYISRVNLRPTDVDRAIDKFITNSTPIGHKFTNRPTANITRKARQAIYRGTLGLNPGSALKNLTQGVNTYAKLGEKWTTVGYMKALRNIASGDDELKRVGVLADNFVQDRNISVKKRAVEKLDKVLFSMFEAVERLNRGAAYYGAKSKALSDGLSESEAVKKGIDTARDTQFTFGSVDTPPVLQSDIGKTLLQFQSFNLKQGEFLAEMVSKKELAGLVRWTAANLVILNAAGDLFGFSSPIDFLPSVKIGGSPLFELGKEVAGATLNAPGEYGEEIDKQERVKRIGKRVVPFIPAGVQAKKTIEGVNAFNQGASTTNSGRVRYPIEQNLENRLRTGLLGQFRAKEAKDYFKNKTKPLGSKDSQQLIASDNKVQSYNKFMQERANDKKIKEAKNKLKSSNNNTTTVGEAVLITQNNGDIKTIYPNKPVKFPKLTGQATVDKKLLSKYKSDLSRKENDIVELAVNGYMTPQQAEQRLLQIQTIRDFLKKVSKKPSRGRSVVTKSELLSQYRRALKASYGLTNTRTTTSASQSFSDELNRRRRSFKQ